MISVNIKNMSKTEADWCKKIEIWWLVRDMYKYGKTYKNTTISWGENGSRGSIGAHVTLFGDNKNIRFVYSQTDSETDQKKNFDYVVQLEQTKCHFGGSRFWFICPLNKNGKYCGRRVGVLYKDGNYFGCRHCYNLTYSSRNESKGGRYSYIKKVLETERKIELLETKSKRLTYAGKLTKKQIKIKKLNKKYVSSLDNFISIEKGLKVNKKGRN
jgi:hypothetical protein